MYSGRCLAYRYARAATYAIGECCVSAPLTRAVPRSVIQDVRTDAFLSSRHGEAEVEEKRTIDTLERRLPSGVKSTEGAR